MKNMKKMLLCLMAAATVICGCRNSGECRISGTVNGEQYEGKRIFLVPLYGPATAETVDSVEIKNGKFAFTPDSMQMYKILLDYHFRFGLQPLLVVGEPGDITVTIDSISHAYGTPQNDSLEQWKTHKEMHDKQLLMMRKNIENLKMAGRMEEADSLKQYADSFHLVHKNYTRRMAEDLKKGPLHEFLKSLYPLTYQRKFPDGRTVTMNADTNEEIPE